MRQFLNKARANLKPRPVCRRRRHPRVLLVEPDYTFGLYHQIFLLACEISVTWTGTVKCALALIARKPFDVVVTEWRGFADGSGLDIIAAVRANPKLQATKVVFLSVAQDEADRIESTAPDAVLYKPELPRVLLHTLRRVLRQKSSTAN